MGAAGRRRAWAAAAVLAVAACSGGDDEAGGDEGTTTTAAASFDERDALVQQSLAATGLGLVANEISLRALRGDGAEYCRTQAPAEMAPHRATLEAATDAEVRRRAGATLADLAAVADACAGGGDGAAVQQAIQRYDASFTQLRQRLDQLLGAG